MLSKTSSLSSVVRKIYRAKYRYYLKLDDLEKKQDENDSQDKAKTTAAIVAKPWPHTITAKPEYEDKNNQEEEHVFISPFGEMRHSGVMQLWRQTQHYN